MELMAFTRNRSSGAAGEEKLLKSAADIAPMSWSSDGRFLLYRSVNAKGFNEVWVLPISPALAKPFPFLQSEESNQSVPRLSPDGRWAAYYSNESGRFEVYLQSFPKPGGNGKSPWWGNWGSMVQGRKRDFLSCRRPKTDGRIV